MNLYVENTRYLEMKRKIENGGSKAMHDSARSYEQNTVTRVFSRTLICAHAPAWLKVTQDVFAKTFSSTCHHVSDCSWSLHPLTSSSLSSSCPFSSSPLSGSSSSMWSELPSNLTLAHRRMRSVAIQTLSQVSDIKVCKTHGLYSVEAKVPSLFEDQTTSWIRIVSGVEKLRQRGNASPRRSKSFGETHCKCENNIDTAINKQLEMELRKWIDIEVKRSKDPCCF